MFMKFHVDNDTKVLVAHRSGSKNPNVKDVIHQGDMKSFSKFREKLANGAFWVTLLKEEKNFSVSVPVVFENHQMKFPTDL